MKIFFTDIFELPLPDGHRFPMEKYRLLREAVTDVGELMVPDALDDEQLARAHDRAYIDAVCQGRVEEAMMRRIGFPWSPQLVERSRRSAGATLAAGRAALEDGVAVNIAGGTHHAGPDFGAGYCVFNDSALAVRNLRHEARARRFLIVDTDVHPGNGTAAILAGDPEAFTLSLHGARNYPFRRFDSDLDIALPDGTGDEEYLDTLARSLDHGFDRARPELVLYVSGADPFTGDKLGRLALSKDGLAARDRMVFAACREREVPVAVAMGGGYARAIADTVAIHEKTVRLAAANRIPAC
ncbi:MAG: histone deacetylase [Planctomycetota bacterium]